MMRRPQPAGAAMAGIETAGMALLRRIDPERAHALALLALRAGLAPLPGPVTSPRLATRLAGMDLPNPVGLAAGFDKDAVALGPLLRAGFGFVEAGAVTPRPQPGNPRPRLFRLAADRAAINRFGFNNAGMAAAAARLALPRPEGIVGLNLGANKDTADRAADYAAVLARCGPLVDFVTVNVSSPNTERLRDLQGKAALAALMDRVNTANAGLPVPRPVFLKIAPDLDPAALDDIARVALDARLAGIIATNTTLSRAGLTDRQAAEAGGLSGAPLLAPSTRVLARLHLRLGAAMPLVGVGGIAGAGDAWAKIRAGARAVQLYTGLVYGGIGLAARIAEGLDAIAAREGLANLSEAVGRDAAALAEEP
jgi:dihydroorotate dehydrogenase